MKFTSLKRDISNLIEQDVRKGRFIRDYCRACNKADNI